MKTTRLRRSGYSCQRERARWSIHWRTCHFLRLRPERRWRWTLSRSSLHQSESDTVYTPSSISLLIIIISTSSSRSSIIVTRHLFVFTALHQPRYSEEISVCPSVRLSVCPSVTRVDCDKAVERSVQIYTPYERTFIPSFLRKRMAGGRRPLLPEILGQPTRVRTKSPIFNQ